MVWSARSRRAPRWWGSGEPGPRANEIQARLKNVKIPQRYEREQRLGKGGGGEVWAVRDRTTGARLALKVLSEGAGEHEARALVREAVALRALEGLGVPRIVAFSVLPTGERFMVRELVEGKSLDEVFREEEGLPWLEPLAEASEQLTVLHRSGLFHGDVKPANVVVGPDGRATLVDLGLATPWRPPSAAARAEGHTPKYAAPEIQQGEPLTVRAEVYALGATLQEGLDERGHTLGRAAFSELSRIAKRATEAEPESRYPSVDEFVSALRRAAGLGPGPLADELPWPILGAEGPGQILESRVLSLGPGDALALSGPPGSGRSTLLRRLAWSLGMGKVPVAHLEGESRAVSDVEAMTLALEPWAGALPGLVLCIDDLASLGVAAREMLRQAMRAGARLVAVASPEDLLPLTAGDCSRFDLSRLEPRVAEELVKRAIVSLPDALVQHLVTRSGGLPGVLRAFVKRLGREPLVSPEDVDTILDRDQSVDSIRVSRDELLRAAELAVDTGRFDLAQGKLDALGAAEDDPERVRAAVARARILLAKGEAGRARSILDEARDASQGPYFRAFTLQRARAASRLGEFSAALELADVVLVERGDDALAAEALSVRGVALAYTGEGAKARQALESAVAVANMGGDKRALAVALGSLGIAHQRSGRTGDARRAYEEALAAAEAASDAWTVATMRLNLAGLAQADGDLGRAIAHLEAAIDLGHRAGGLVAIQQARLNLANLDLYVGRHARARTAIETLIKARAELGPGGRAQLLGLEADLANRTGDGARARRYYDLCAVAYEALGRPQDGAEARLEALLLEAREPMADGTALLRQLEALRQAGQGGFGEHEALAAVVRGQLLLLVGEEGEAKTALDTAHELARSAGKRELAWRALEARARLASSQGSVASARRDTEAALAILEEVAVKLPRDLREVFWDDPKRRALRSSHGATLPTASAPSPQSPGASGRSQHGVGAALPDSDRLSRIFEITRDLARERDLQRLLARVTDHAIALVGAERGFVLLADAEGEVFAQTVRGTRGDEGHVKFSRSVAEKVLATGEAVIAASARDDESLAEAVSVHQLMIQSIACVPIRGPSGKSIGALYLETRLRPGLRFREELPTLSAFADQVAIAIESARLIEENQRRADELAVANDELQRAHARLEEALGRRTEQLAATRRDLKQVRAELRSHFGYAGLVGTSAPMRKLYAILERVKDAEVPVLITGESGTGKEVVAKAIHHASPRAKSPFIGVNCGAIPGNLLESELFGSVRGAFTGADRDRKGLFREAEGGTILLDEIGEMPQKMQAGLLRVLQEKTVRPVGGGNEQPVDVRIVAATHRELSQMVREGAFREDLYYRLHVIEVQIPALRDRLDDIPALVDHFLGIFSARHRRDRKTVERAAMRRLASYDWPGNVRQLEHVLLNGWLMSEGSEIGSDDINLPAVPPEPRASTPRARTHGEFRDTEKERILEALARAGWNRVQAAKLVGIPRRTFYRRLKEYGILAGEGEEGEEREE